MNEIIDRPKGRSLKPLRELWPYLRRYRRTLVLALGALLIASAALLVLPLAFRNVIDQGMVVQDRATIDFYFVAFLAAAVAFGLFAALRFYLVTWLGERVVADVRSRRLRARHPHGPDVLRSHAHRRSAVAADDRHDAGAIDRRREPVDHAALGDPAGRRTGTADRDQPVARRHDPDRHSAGHRTDDHRRAPAAHAVAAVAGSHRRHQRPRGRNAQRDPDRAGVHARIAAHGALQQGGRGFVRGRDPSHAHARGADGDRHDDDLRRGHVRALARRAPRARGANDRRPAEPVPDLRDVRCDFRRFAQRDVGRSAARRGRDGAPGRAEERTAGDRRPAAT